VTNLKSPSSLFISATDLGKKYWQLEKFVFTLIIDEERDQIGIFDSKIYKKKIMVIHGA